MKKLGTIAVVLSTTGLLSLGLNDVFEKPQATHGDHFITKGTNSFKSVKDPGGGGVINNEAIKDPGGSGSVSNEADGDTGGPPSYGHADTPAPQA